MYLLLLAILIWCQLHPNRWLYIGAMTASCVAVSLYAAGGIFALEVILLHVIFFRGWKVLPWSATPLVSYLWFIGRYVKPSAETTAMSNVLRNLRAPAVREIAHGAICYYASALVQGWPVGVRPVYGDRELVLLGIAALACCTTVAWALYTLLLIALKVHRGETLGASAYAKCFMGLLSLFVFGSALSAAVLWIARARIFGAALGMPAHFAVLTSNRYAATSSVAMAVFLFVGATGKWTYVRVPALAAFFLLIAGCGVSTIVRTGSPRDLNVERLEDAATALLMGVSPASQEASAVWPGVESDGYWSKELGEDGRIFTGRGRIVCVPNAFGGPSPYVANRADLPIRGRTCSRERRPMSA